MDDWIEILEIMKKYRNDCNDEWPFWAEHDVIGLNIDPTIVSDEDMETLDELGVFFSAEYDSLIKFV